MHIFLLTTLEQYVIIYIVKCFWRNTQVWLKGPVLKTGRSATARGFESLFLRQKCFLYIAEWSSLVARWAHNPKVGGSNPSPATKIMVPWCSGYHVCLSRRRSRVRFSSEPPFFLAPQLSRYSRGLKILVSLVQFPLEPPFILQSMRSQLSWIEYLATNQKVRGSNPFERTILFGKWLNLVEHLVWDQGVAGSNPVFPTIQFINSVI